MLGAQPVEAGESKTGTTAPVSKTTVKKDAMEGQTASEAEQTAQEQPAEKRDPTVETFQLPDELMVFKNEALPKLEVKSPKKKLTEDELAALRRWV